MSEFDIRPLTPEDRNWVAKFLDDSWGSTKIVTRAKSYYGHLLPGFVAIQSGRRAKKDDLRDADGKRILGLLTYRVEEDECEVMTLNSIVEDSGAGTALLDALKEAARAENYRRLWLITTNDNLNALRFYQQRGFALVAVYRDAIAETRKQKPQIPVLGQDRIPVRDEIELEFLL
jgi:DNA-3-methyladenine glycosylase I